LRLISKIVYEFNEHIGGDMSSGFEFKRFWRAFSTEVALGALALAGVYVIENISSGLPSPEQQAAEQFFRNRRPDATAPAEIHKKPVVNAAPQAPASSEPDVPKPVNPSPLKEPGSKTETVKTLGDRFADMAMELYEEHKYSPYVWGGESFASYEDTINNPKYQGVVVTRTQPQENWRVGLPSFEYPAGPGVDCSGWIWYVGAVKADSKPFVDGRRTAEGYRRITNQLLKSGRYGSEEIQKHANRGDLLFLLEKNQAYHVAVYLGNGLICECSGTEKPDYENIPASEWEDWRKIAGPRGKTDWHRGGLQISPLSKYEDKIVALNRIY
jgi:cell wall-associated NlpC family hydrolase